MKLFQLSCCFVFLVLVSGGRRTKKAGRKQLTEAEQFAKSFLEAADEDKDGKISWAEAVTSDTRLFNHCDTSGEGELKFDEYMACEGGLGDETSFAQQDKNSDGHLDLEEFLIQSKILFDSRDINPKDGHFDWDELVDWGVSMELTHVIKKRFIIKPPSLKK